MDVSESVAHAKWECKDYVVWIPKVRGQVLDGELRKLSRPGAAGAGETARVCRGGGPTPARPCPHAPVDSAEVLRGAGPRVIKGKSAIHIARTSLGRRQTFTGQHVCARDYHVSTVGRNEAAIREYIRRQEAEDQRLDPRNSLDR